MIELNNISMDKIRPYISNVKVLGGAGIILFALYTGVTEIPAKWSKYFSTRGQNETLVKSKESLHSEEVKLKAISSELDKLTTKVAQVEEGNSPELAIIDIAQDVVNLSEQTQNIYVNLTPGKPTTLDVETWVTLPVNIAGVPVAPAGAPPPGQPAAAGAPPAAPAPAPAGVPPPAGGSKALNAFQYTLIIKGTYINLATFIHELTEFPDFVLIERIELTPVGSGGGSSSPSPDKDLIQMSLDFTIPWEFGRNVPKRQSPKPYSPEENLPPELKQAEGAAGPEGEKPAEGQKPAEPASAGEKPPAPGAKPPNQSPPPSGAKVSPPAAKPADKPAGAPPAAKPAAKPAPQTTVPAKQPAPKTAPQKQGAKGSLFR